METMNISRTTIAFINDKSPVIDLIHNDLIASGVGVIFRSDNIMEGNNQLSSLKMLPDICIIDLDFYDKGVMKQVRELRRQFPTLKLIAHSDIDDENIINKLSGLGFLKYVLIGEDIKKAINGVVNG